MLIFSPFSFIPVPDQPAKSPHIHKALSMHVKSLQSYPTLCYTMDCSPPGCSVHWILKARILEWIAMLSSRESSQPGDQTCVSWVSCITGDSLSLGHCRSPPSQSIICPQLERCLIWLPAESRPEWLTGLCHCKGYKTLKTHHLTLVISASLQILERKSQTLIWPPSLLLWQKPQQLSGGKTGKLTLWHTRDEKQEAERRR